MSKFLQQPKLPNRFVVEFDGFRKFRFHERVKIMLGFNVIAKAKVMIDKRSGRSWTSLTCSLTEHSTDAAVIEANQRRDLQAQPDVKV